MISLHSSSLDNDGGGGVFRHLRPTTRTFNVVLNALAKGDGGYGGVWASKILNRLVELGADKDGPRPDVITYNPVLSAWSRSASVCPTSVSSFGEEGDDIAIFDEEVVGSSVVDIYWSRREERVQQLRMKEQEEEKLIID